LIASHDIDRVADHVGEMLSHLQGL